MMKLTLEGSIIVSMSCPQVFSEHPVPFGIPRSSRGMTGVEMTMGSIMRRLRILRVLFN
jgi:hypothetical protein